MFLIFIFPKTEVFFLAILLGALHAIITSTHVSDLACTQNPLHVFGSGLLPDVKLRQHNHRPELTSPQ